MSIGNSEHIDRERRRKEVAPSSLLIKNFARSLSRAEGVAIRVRIIKKHARAHPVSGNFPRACVRAHERLQKDM